MPTYLYECPNHGEFEETHSIKEKLEECPLCKKKGIISEVTRLISSGTSFVLTGGGWAKEGYEK